MKMFCKYLVVALFILPLNCFSQYSKVLPYANNKVISDERGNPRDSLMFYFPGRVFTDTTHFLKYFDRKRNCEATRVTGTGCSDTKETISKNENIAIDEVADVFEVETDSFQLHWYSFELFKMKEPIIYNYRQNDEIFRFTWLRSFHRPVVIKVEKGKDAAYISTKMLERNPPIFRYLDSTGKEVEQNYNMQLIVNSKKRMSDKDYSMIKTLIDSIDVTIFPYLADHPCSFISDGAAWIFEIANKDGYYEIYRQSPQQETWSSPDEKALNKIGKMLIELSDVKDEKVY